MRLGLKEPSVCRAAPGLLGGFVRDTIHAGVDKGFMTWFCSLLWRSSSELLHDICINDAYPQISYIFLYIVTVDGSRRGSRRPVLIPQLGKFDASRCARWVMCWTPLLSPL